MLLFCLGEGERRRKEGGEKRNILRIVCPWCFMASGQGFQTWPTTPPSDTLVPGLDVPSKGGDETAAISSWLWMVGDDGSPWG